MFAYVILDHNGPLRVLRSAYARINSMAKIIPVYFVLTVLQSCYQYQPFIRTMLLF